MRKVSMPFLSDTATTTETAPLTPVEQAVSDSREAHKRAIADARTRYEQNALDAFERSEQLRKERFLSEWREENPWADFKPYYKYAGWNDESVFRDLQEPQDRLQALLDAKLYEQYLKCLLVRHGGSATVKEIKEWLRPHIEVDGNREIRPGEHELARLMTKGYISSLKFAEGLSDELHALLTNSYMVRCGLHSRVEFSWMTEHNDRSSW